MKTCANCGNEVREGARFCASCGAQQAPPDPQPSSNEPPPPAASSASKRRLRWVAAAVIALLLAAGAAAAAVSLTGGDGSSQAIPPNGATPAADAAGVDCDELNSFATDFAPTLAAAQSDPGDAAEAMEELLDSFSELSSGAPDDVRQDFETLSETMQEWVDAASELGLEPGELPDEDQQEEILELFGDVLEDPEYLDAATNFSEWMETVLGQCLGTDTDAFDPFTETETTDSSDSFYGDETTTDETTTEAGGDVDEDLEEMCDGYLAVVTLGQEENSNPTIDDVEGLAAVIAELASKAPDSSLPVEPKASLDAMARELESLADRLSELGLDPGSDEALDDPQIDAAIDALNDADADLNDWFKTQCSAEDVAAYERIVNG